MPFIFLSLLKPEKTKKASVNIITDGIINFILPSNVIIEKSYSPCKSKAIKTPAAIIIFLFLTSQKEIAMEYPITPEHNVCKKVAPINLIRTIMSVRLINWSKDINPTGANK